MNESPYLVREIEDHPKPEYMNDLRILRRFVQNGSFGHRASEDVVFQRLKSRYAQAYDAFGEERRQVLFEKYQHSPYIEQQLQAFPNNPEQDSYLKALKRLRHLMIMFELGYGGQAMTFTTPRNKYQEAQEAFEWEL